MKRIEFQKTGHDPQIDYIKGLCILFVILTHCMYREELSSILFPYWGDTAVPIFLLIQVFHYYKRGNDIRMPKLKKLWRRIIMPYILLVAITFALDYLVYFDNTNGRFNISLYWNKRGPGSYYIFIYLQFAFLLPLLAPLFRKISTKWLPILFLIASQLIEIISSLTQCPDSIYRITFFRYTFLIFLGYLLATKGLVVNKLTIILTIISILFIYVFNYTTFDLQPWFCTNLSFWPLCHWICYIYISYFFLWLLKFLHSKTKQPHKITNFIEEMGQYSYEIYLFQIFYYSIPKIYILQFISIFGHPIVERLLYIMLSPLICLSIIPVIKLIKNKR